MKKIVIWLVGLVMGLCCVALLVVQLSFFDTVVEMRKQHFQEGVRRSLYQVSYQLEQEEMGRVIDKELRGFTEQAQIMYEHIGSVEDVAFLEELMEVKPDASGSLSLYDEGKRGKVPRIMKERAEKRGNVNDRNSVEAVNGIVRDLIKRAYMFEKDLFDRAIYEAVFNTSSPIDERIDINTLEKKMHDQLVHCGIDLPFQLVLVGSANDTLLDTGGYEGAGPGTWYREALFKNDISNNHAVIAVCFPDSYMNNYIYGSVKFMLPSLLFSFVMLITFAVTLYMAIRHKKITKMKNDFVNNMTHEFKTPISTISLASQMLQDTSVVKSPETLSRLAGVISNEAKRLRFQVDKVLQISMFDDKNNAALKMKELDANELVSGVLATFAVKAEQGGGRIVSFLDAPDPYVYVDEMHFTNVIFNLMDNALKYKQPDVPVQLEVRTWNSGGKFCLSVKDNGIGIPKEHLKKIFERFYRVSGGNVHDVKGFGLGLAYVKHVVRAHGGTIKAESEPGDGTTFVIVLPLK